MNKRELGKTIPAYVPENGGQESVGPFSQKRPFDVRDMLIQGDSVRQTWGFEEPKEVEERRPIRRDPPAAVNAAGQTDDLLQVRLAEELDHARRMLDVTGDILSADPVTVSRHGLAIQSLDIVGQILGHIASVIRSDDPATAVDAIGMCALKARLTRTGRL